MKWLKQALVDMFKWIGELFKDVFKAGWDMVKDAFAWLVEQLLDVVISAISDIDLSGLDGVKG